MQDKSCFHSVLIYADFHISARKVSFVHLDNPSHFTLPEPKYLSFSLSDRTVSDICSHIIASPHSVKENIVISGIIFQALIS